MPDTRAVRLSAAENGAADPGAAQSRDGDAALEFARAVATELTAEQKTVQCRFLYDAAGSALFERICAQPEYYQTRTEAALLHEHAPAIAAATGPVRLMELGSGTSIKTQHLLRAYLQHDTTPHYVSVDVSGAALDKARRTIGGTFPEVRFSVINGTYETAFSLLPKLAPVLVLFLGSTIGNFDEDDAAAFFRRLVAHLEPGSFFLLGVDLEKDVEVLEAAYNDAAGVTAAFTRNLFARMNRELGSAIDLEAVKHEAFYNREARRIEIYARFVKDQEIHLAPLGETIHVAAGEMVRTEISRKFRLDELSPFLASCGFRTHRVFTDEREWFALLLLQR